MDFVLHAAGMPFNGDTINKQSLGGSETAAYYLAKELVMRGHKVKLFTSSTEDGTWDGVTYCWHGDMTEATPLGDRFTFYATNTPHDVLIIQRHPLAFHKDYASKINVWQLHDLALFRSADAITGGISRVTLTTTVSAWHGEQVRNVYGISKDAMAVVNNGVDPSLYAKRSSVCEAAQQVSQHPFAMLYQSRPERGLEHLVRPGGIMSRLADTNVHLFICGYENTTQHMADYYRQLSAWASQLPNVTLLGALPKADLAQVQQACQLMLYPTEFEEVSCITAMEAMHANLPLLSSECGALPETCRDSGSLLLPLKNGKADEDAFVAQIKFLVVDLNDAERVNASRIGVLREQQRKAQLTRTWSYATNQLLDAIQAITLKANARQSTLLRHYIDTGDVEAARLLLAESPPTDAIGVAAQREIETMYSFLDSPGQTLAHYEAWEGKSIDQQGGEDETRRKSASITTSTRFMGIHAMVERAVKQGAKRILEFGASYGHILLPLAKSYPEVEFVGVDFVARSVDMANKWVAEEGISNATFHVGTLDTISDHGTFDAIIAAEILEHIRPVKATLETLRASLNMGGALITTTPYGRWEWTGHDNFKMGREHVHQFERNDLEDLFGQMPHELMCGPAGVDAGNAPCGSWVAYVVPTDAEFGTVNYQRKRVNAVPRQTVSLCMIVKDGEATIRKALASVINFVDEVIISVDKGTSDGTVAVIERFKGENPHKPFTLLKHDPAVEIGFDAARNISIAQACGDWILWMDADEEIPAIANIQRLLCQSSPNAYGIAQIHYAVDPPQVLTTDYPARLFRNHRGVQFYGVVHEHPEDAPGGSAIPHTHLVRDIQILHYGYVNERVRRNRFVRNWPLLQRDIEKHPNRTLNKFLLLRDLAQNIAFERERGIDPRAQVTRAQQGCELFRQLIGTEHLRMMVDSLQYYSLCVDALGGGFVADVTINSTRPEAHGQSFAVNVKGHFQNGDDYLKVVNKIAQESIRNYESRYA